MAKKNLVIIGAGPGGYEAAIMAAKLGLDVTIIEKDLVGGICLNQGCIPTKLFLFLAEKVKSFKDLKKLGIEVSDYNLDLKKLNQYKNRKLKQIRQGILNLFDQNNINFINGKAELIDQNTIKVKKQNEDIILNPDYILLATGSVPILPDNFNYDGENILTSKEVLALEEVPESIVIIGGNIIGCEIGQYLSRFGTKVTIVEAAEHILPLEDLDVVEVIEKSLKKDKIKFLSEQTVKEINNLEDEVEVILDNDERIKAQKALIAIGRKPNLEILEDNKLDLKTEDGFVWVNEKLQTNKKNIYAIGDLINSPQLAHVASHEGINAIEIIANEKEKIEYDVIPECVYTSPQIAHIGLSENELKGKNYKQGTFKLKANAKANTCDQAEGFVKILTDQNNLILGAYIVSENASELISELSLAMKEKIPVTQLSEVIHPHPSLAESILEAARDVNNYSINKPIK